MTFAELQDTARRYSRGERVPALAFMELYDAVHSGRVVIKRREPKTEQTEPSFLDDLRV